MGFRVTGIGFPACVEKLEEEVIVIWIAIALAAEGFDFVVDAFQLASRDVIGCVSDNALKMRIEKAAKPQPVKRGQQPVLSLGAEAVRRGLSVDRGAREPQCESVKR